MQYLIYSIIAHIPKIFKALRIINLIVCSKERLFGSFINIFLLNSFLLNYYHVLDKFQKLMVQKKK